MASPIQTETPRPGGNARGAPTLSPRDIVRGIPAAAWVFLAAGLGLFLFGQLYFSERVGVWSEEVSTYPTGPSRAAEVDPDGALRVAECGEEPSLRVNGYRPELALCAGGGSWPIMGAAYYSTWLYWPFASVLPESVFILRKVGLLFGLVTLLLAFFIAARMTDPVSAAAGVFAASLSSAFVLPHSLLVHFELLQLPLAALSAVALATAPRDERLRPRRAACIGLAAGLAVASNVKAVFLLAALGLLLRRNGRLALLTGRGRRVALTAAALPLLPMAAFAVMDPRSGMSSQLIYRFENIVARVTSGSAFLEPANTLRFWTDVAAYGDESAGVSTGATALALVLALVLPTLALGRIVLHFLRALLRRDHDPFAACLGALVSVYILVAALLWDQAPAANYAPLHVVFGVATGTSAVAFGRWLARRAGAAPLAGAVAGAVLVVAAGGGFAYHTYRRGDPGRLVSATNAAAERDLVSHLVEAPGGTIVTASYNLAGVVDAVSGGRLRATRVDAFVSYCGDVGQEGEEGLAPCVRDRLALLVADLGRVRLVAPARHATSDEAATSLIVPALEELTRAGVVRAAEEASFAGVETGPVLTLWDVRPL